MPEQSQPEGAGASVPEEEGPTYTRPYTRYVLGVLLVVYVVNFIDRQILAILAQSIKVDLGLTDTEIGALSGLADYSPSTSGPRLWVFTRWEFRSGYSSAIWLA